ncbi:DNA recombination protein RmuC [Ruminococcus sp. Marseille-P6503]|uniref:DNA recombination protein RmuC n=1 Tax=Ruminococcus sp. Marseille-P6503 TaxID=2364796 RepID=UPI000F53996A|nr:DNA recombination protein RmuC [Ruminococcus sp. Marseille-P6503]
MDTAILIILILCAVMLVILILKQNGGKTEEETASRLEKMQSELTQQQSRLRQELSAGVSNSIGTMSGMLSENQKSFAEGQDRRLAEMDRHIVEKQQEMNNSVQAQLKQFEERLKTLETTNQQKLEDMRATMSRQLASIQEDNAKQLDKIRGTVDEKLQESLEKKMNESFKLVSERLEQVYKGLGEMQSLASGVGDLKKVLSNVKTRGILGEIQLGAILQEILTPEQYETEVATVPGSRERVEFAVRLPASDGGEHIYLPIDSKFPGDTYAALQEAYESGSADAVKAAYKNLEGIIKKCAKDIHDKYICPPYTTNFAIMFLPFEGLYAEVVNHGLVEALQRDYSINIAGPSTMAAMLNSLQMGFKTLQIQKRSSEVWQVLGAVKTEFGKFEEVLSSARNRIRQLDDDLDKLVGVRTRGINRKLREIEQLDSVQAEKLLSINDD